MAMIAANACDCYQVILHPTSKWVTFNLSDRLKSKILDPPRPPQLQCLPFFSSFGLGRLLLIVISKNNDDFAMERRFVT